MVERTKSETFDRFVGKIVSVKIEKSKFNNNNQYHIEMTPIDKQIGGKTGSMHEWLTISASATDTTVPEGSALDKYLLEVETLMPETKKLKTHAEIMSALVGRKFLFVQKKLGKSFEGKDAKDYWIPYREA